MEKGKACICQHKIIKDHNMSTNRQAKATKKQAQGHTNAEKLRLSVNRACVSGGSCVCECVHVRVQKQNGTQHTGLKCMPPEQSN